jgi:hypothetical protein
LTPALTADRLVADNKALASSKEPELGKLGKESVI